MKMKILAVLCLPLLLAVPAKAQVSARVSFSDNGINQFFLAVGQTYNVPQRQVVLIHERQIPEEELPVVFFISSRAHVRPSAVVNLRLAGRSWMDITRHYRLSPSIYYIALNGDPGPQYGNAYGQWRQPRNRWNKIRLSDDDIIRMVNLRFVSAHYGVRTDEVVRLRGQHSNFINVTQEISSPDYRARRAEIQKQNNARNNDRGRGQGRGNRGGNK